MKDFVIFSLGCKTNQAEGQSLAEAVNKIGYSVTIDLVPARYYVLNTCSVTAEADKKSRQAVARILKLNNNAEIFVIGCASQYNAQAFINKPNVRFVGGTAQKAQAFEQILQIIQLKNNGYATPSSMVIAPFSDTFECLDKPYKSRMRAYIKVQDGCNRYCSYCIVPYLRGKSRSRELSDIMLQARLLAAESKELIITGINLSDYRIGGVPALAELVRSFASIDAARKRLGSLSVDAVTRDLLEAVREAGFCQHFHLSVQSGSDTVLQRMNRRYTTADVLEKVRLIREYYPNCGITSDIITGFPQETEQEFNETVQTVKQAAFSDVHIFPYSERGGTKAAGMPQVDISIRKQRAAVLDGVCAALKKDFLQAQIGKEASVYIEDAAGGYTENYCKLYVNAPIGEIVCIKPLKLYKDGLM